MSEEITLRERVMWALEDRERECEYFDAKLLADVVLAVVREAVEQGVPAIAGADALFALAAAAALATEDAR